jgi:hypothetical protein
MPSQQTVILVTLIGSVIGSFAGAIFIIESIYKLTKALKEGNMPPTVKRLCLLLSLIIFSLLMSTVGLWMLFHLPKPEPIVPCPVPKQCPVCPTPSPLSSIHPLGKNSPKTSGVTATQSGAGNQQATIGGAVKQGGNGACQQNIINGNGNTNSCGPQAVTASDPQVALAIKQLKKSPTLAGSRVQIAWEDSVDNGGELAAQLKKILEGDDISVEIASAHTNWTPGVPSYSGLSFAVVSIQNKPLADEIEKSFLKAGIISSPMNPEKRDYDIPGQQLIIMIRKP